MFSNRRYFTVNSRQTFHSRCTPCRCCCKSSIPEESEPQMSEAPLVTHWQGLASSIIGSGHIRRGLPCQDASLAILTPRPALIVCDGRGSAQRSQDGAQHAVRAFKSQLAIFEPLLASILDVPEERPEAWQQFSRIIYRTLMQVKLDLGEQHQLPESEFDFTVSLAITGRHHLGCFQVGDGAIVLRQDGVCQTVFPPDKGEFANQTCFPREHGDVQGNFHSQLFPAAPNSGIAITSDGPQYLMFNLADMTPAPIFDYLFDELLRQNLIQQDLMDYLTRNEWNNDPRGTDDRSLAILVPQAVDEAELPEPDDALPLATENDAGMAPEPLPQDDLGSDLEPEDFVAEAPDAEWGDD